MYHTETASNVIGLEDNVLKALAMCRQRECESDAKAHARLFRMDSYVKASLEKHSVAMTPGCRDVLRNVEMVCGMMRRCIDLEHHDQFFSMQNHVVNAMIKAKFFCFYGRDVMAKVADEFEAELERNGFVDVPEFYTDADREGILSNDRLSLYRRVVIVQSRRQYGKSMIMQFLLACFLVVLTPEVCLMTSNHQNLNSQNRAAVVSKLRAFGEKIVIGNMSYVELGSGNVLAVRSQAGIRGSRPTTIAVDEGAFCRESIFSRLLAPIMVNPDRTMFVFSTPNGDNESWRQLLLATDTFRIIVIQDVCEACRSKGKDSCLCLSHHAPDLHQSREVRETLKAFYRTDEQAYQEEILGLSISQHASALHRPWIEDFFNSPMPPRPKLIPHRKRIYVSYDPTGHNVSGTALMAAVHDQYTGKVAVIHVDYMRFEGVTIDTGVQMLVSAMIGRLAKRFPGHTLITALETNNNKSHVERVAGMFNQCCRVHKMQCIHLKHKEGTDMYPGLWTDNYTKMQGYCFLRTMLREKSLLMADSISCAEAETFSKAKRPGYVIQGALDNFKLQTMALRVTRGVNNCLKISGKESGNDDLAITLLNLIYLMRGTQYSIDLDLVPDQSHIPPELKKGKRKASSTTSTESRSCRRKESDSQAGDSEERRLRPVQ